jgi:DNA-binding transcriptional ArsR family regulator
MPPTLAQAHYFHYIGNMEEIDAIRSLSALAHSLRLRVFRMLVVAGPEGLTPGAIAEQLDVPAATLSFHLKELMHAQLVTQERDGRNLIYRAAFAHMNDLLGFLTENCCQGEACLDPSATSCKC